MPRQLHRAPVPSPEITGAVVIGEQMEALRRVRTAGDCELVVIDVAGRWYGDRPDRIAGRGELDVCPGHLLGAVRLAPVQGEVSVGLLLQVATDSLRPGELAIPADRSGGIERDGEHILAADLERAQGQTPARAGGRDPDS